MKIYKLNGVVINPRFAGMRIRGEFLREGMIIGQLLDSSREVVQYDVMNGIIEDYDFKRFQREVEQLKSNHSIEITDSMLEEEFKKWYVEERGHSEHDFIQLKLLQRERFDEALEHNRESLTKRIKAGVLCGETAALLPHKKRFLVALANHQVSGDELTKGLKASGFDLNVKLQESYLGGWNASGCSLDELLDSIEQRSE